MIDAHETAGQIIETLPLIIRRFREEIRKHDAAELSVPQFRVLAFLRYNEGATLTDVASQIGLMRPTMSKMIDNLVRRGWVERETSPEDRRCMQLSLTSRGAGVFKAAQDEMRTGLAEDLRALPAGDQETILCAMKLIQQAFAPKPGNGAAGMGGR